MMQLLLRLTASSGREHQLVQALHPHVRRALLARGCRGAHLAADLEDAGVIWYCEEWDEPRALEANVRSADFQELLALMEMSADAPLLEIRTIHDTKGLDYVARLRASPTGEPS